MIVTMERVPKPAAGLESTMWDVVETSRRGHVRLRRLMLPMTEDEARQWAKTHSVKLRRADEFPSPADLSARARAYKTPERLRRHDSGETA